jgi:hypothetical protein
MTSKAPPIAIVCFVNPLVVFLAVFFFAVLRAFLAATVISFRRTDR